MSTRRRCDLYFVLFFFSIDFLTFECSKWTSFLRLSMVEFFICLAILVHIFLRSEHSWRFCLYPWQLNTNLIDSANVYPACVPSPANIWAWWVLSVDRFGCLIWFLIVEVDVFVRLGHWKLRFPRRMGICPTVCVSDILEDDSTEKFIWTFLWNLLSFIYLTLSTSNYCLPWRLRLRCWNNIKNCPNWSCKRRSAIFV